MKKGEKILNRLNNLQKRFLYKMQMIESVYLSEENYIAVFNDTVKGSTDITINEIDYILSDEQNFKIHKWNLIPNDKILLNIKGWFAEGDDLLFKKQNKQFNLGVMKNG